MIDRLIGLLAAASMCMPCAAAPPITAAAFAPDGKSVVIGSQSGIELRSWPDLASVKNLATQLLHVHDLAFSPNGKWLVASGGEPAVEGIVELYAWPTATLLDRRTIHDDLTLAVSWNSDNSSLACPSADHAVSIVPVSDAKLGKPTLSLNGHSRSVLSAVFLPDGKQVVSAGVDQSVRLWDLSTSKLRRTLDNHTADVIDLEVCPNTDAERPLIASASSDRTVRLWQPTIGRLVRFVRLPVEPLDIAWTRDGNRLVASCVDGHLRVIDPDTVEVIADVAAIDGWAYAVVASPVSDAVFVAGANGQMKRVPLNIATRSPR